VFSERSLVYGDGHDFGADGLPDFPAVDFAGHCNRGDIFSKSMFSWRLQCVCDSG